MKLEQTNNGRQSQLENTELHDSGIIGRTFVQLSSGCSNAIHKIIACAPKMSINRVASAGVVGSLIAGATYSALNPDPFTKNGNDVFGGMAIALGSSTVISGITAAIQYFRRKPKDAAMWSIGIALAGLPLLFQNSIVAKISTNSDILPFNATVFPLSKSEPTRQGISEQLQNISVEKIPPNSDKLPVIATIFPPSQSVPTCPVIPEEIKAPSTEHLREECQPDGLERIGDKINLLSCSLLNKAKKEIDDPERWRRLSGPTSLVRFLNNEPLVIKRYGFDLDPLAEKKELAQDLHNKMEVAQQLLLKNGYHHLAIANTAVYKEWVIQTKFPVDLSRNCVMQMGMYLENLDLFTDAIKEFTSFLCQYTLKDLKNRQTAHHYIFLSSDGGPRFDNAALMIERDQEKTRGKIALLDLDTFSPEKQSNPISSVKDAVRFFPRHLEEIIQVAKQFIPSIEESRSMLEKTKDEALEYYAKVYSNHLRFLEAKGVTFFNPNHFEISPKRKMELQKRIASGLIEVLRDPYYEIKENVENKENSKLNQEFQSAAVDIIQAVEEFIKSRLQFDHPGDENILSNEMLVAHRKILFDRHGRVYWKEIGKMEDQIQESLEKLNLDIEYRFYIDLIDDIEKIVFTEMAKGGDIASYFPKKGEIRKATIWV